MSTLKSSNDHLTLNADGTSKDIKFQADGTEKMVLKSDGKLGVGVTPETWESSFVAVQIGNAGAIAGRSSSNHMTVSANTYTSASGDPKYINTDYASHYQMHDGKHTFKVAASGSADANISFTTGFEVLNDGKARAKNGLLFGTDTATANALDDYEEGTWTPGFMLGSPTYTTTYGRGGHYTKIGEIVTLHCELYMGSISFGDASQEMRIGPLPYNSNASAGTTFGLAHSGCIRLSNFYTEGSTYNTGGIGQSTMITIYPRIITNVNYITLDISVGNNHGGSRFKNAAFHNGSGLAFGITYRA